MPEKADTALAFLLNLSPMRDLRSVATAPPDVPAAALASAAASLASFADFSASPPAAAPDLSLPSTLLAEP